MFQAARLPPTLPVLIFLGVDERSNSSPHSAPSNPHDPVGPPYFALEVQPTASPSPPSFKPTSSFHDARTAASHLSVYEAGLFGQARAMIDWNTRNKFCAACGRLTYSLWSGWKRGCMSVVDGVEGGGEPCPST